MSNLNEDKITFHIEKQTIENRKYFVYQEQRYPIDFDKIKMNCRYFYQNRKQYKETENIDLLSENEKSIELTEEAIKGFISICQNEECQLSHSTINSLHYLASKYDFPELKRLTNDYLNKYSSELCLDTLLFKIKEIESSPNQKEDIEKYPYHSLNNDNNINTIDEENYITKHLKKYIKQEKMLELPIPIIDRILHNYFRNDEEEKEVVELSEVIDFLFNVLDVKEIRASILFRHVDFKEHRVDTIKRLVEHYSDKFDFNMINSTLAKSTTELTNELIKQKEEHEILFSQMQKCIEEEKDELKRLKEESIRKEKEYEEKKIELINQYSNEIEQIKNDFQNRMTIIEQRCSNLALLKFKRVIIEFLNIDFFKKITKESKLNIIDQIIEDQNVYSKIDDSYMLVKQILFLFQYYEALSNYENIKKSKDEINQLILDNIDNELIEIEYPTKSFDIICNMIYDVKVQKKYLNQFTISVLIENDEYFEHKFNINKFVNICKFKINNEKINHDMFSEMVNLNRLDIKGNIRFIDESSFKDLINLKKIIITSSVTNFGSKAFENCTSLAQINIPSSVTSIGDNIFKGCKEIIFSKDMTHIPSNSCKGCTSLTQITIPSSVKSIGDNAFENCTSLTQINIPSSVTSIGDNAFKGCTSLTELSIPSTLKTIGKNIFDGCSKLERIKIDLSQTKFDGGNQKQNENSKSLFYHTNIDKKIFNEISAERQFAIISIIHFLEHNKNNTNIQNLTNILLYLKEEKQRSKSST